MKRSKGYLANAAKIDRDALYSPLEAVKLAKETSSAKFDATVEVALRLGVDPRKADQMVRSTVILPHGTGKTARVLVFATGERAEAARAAGADHVGGDELIDEVAKGFLDFDAVVADPALMGKVGRLGRVLGPRGLMPNPKTGTVTPDVAKAVSDIKGGKIEFRVDRHSNLHLVIGKASFSTEQLVENYAAALDEVLRAKPSSSKGKFLKKVTFTTTMGPGIPVDANRTRNLLEDSASKPEKDFAYYFEEASLITMGLCYEKHPRFSGGVYNSFVRRLTSFSEESLTKSLKAHERIAEMLLELDAKVGEAVAKLKAKGFISPYLKAFVVGRSNPLRFMKEPPELEELIKTIRGKVERMNVDKIKQEDITASGGGGAADEES